MAFTSGYLCDNVIFNELGMVFTIHELGMVLCSEVRSTMLRTSEPSDRASNGSDHISAMNSSRTLGAEMKSEPLRRCAPHCTAPTQSLRDEIVFGEFFFWISSFFFKNCILSLSIEKTGVSFIGFVINTNS